MAHQFKPVDRDAEMLLPPNMLDWVPEGHAVRVVICTVERLMTRDLLGRLVPPAPKGSAAGRARYDPVMLLTVWMYAYLRGVLSTRAVEDRCRYDATFRVACGRAIPDHTTFSRFRRHLFGLGELAAQVIAGARKAAADEDADKGVLPGTDLLLGADTAPGPDPRSRAGRALACLEDLQEEREAAESAAREQGRAYLEALAAQQLRLEMAIA